MMTRPFPIFSTVLALSLLLPLEPAFSQNVQVQIGSTSRAIPPHFWGIANPIDFEIGKRTTWDEKDIEPFIRDLGFEHIRGAGGTGDNYYMWKEGILMNSKDPRYADVYGKEKVNAVEGTNLIAGDPPLMLADIFALPNDLNLPYVFALNVIAQSPADIADEVREIKKVAKQPVSLELGNELYASADMHAFPTVKDYVTKAQSITAAIHAVDPSIPTGIVAVGPELQRGVSGSHQRDPAMEAIDWETSFAGRIVDWNSILAASPDAYDAVIVHDYMPVRTLDGVTTESFMARGFAYNQATLADLQAQAAQFKGKPFWLTEWGILPVVMLGEKDPAKKNHVQFMKTAGVAMILMERALRYLETGSITMLSYHCLDAPIGFGLIQHEKPGNMGALVTLPNYDTFKELGALFAAYPCSYPVTLPPGPTNKVEVSKGQQVDLTEMAAWAFGDNSGPKAIVIFNHTAHDLVADLGDRQAAVTWTYGGGDVMPNLGNNPTDWRFPPPVHPMPDTTAKPASHQITLAPFTVVVGKLQ